LAAQFSPRHCQQDQRHEPSQRRLGDENREIGFIVRGVVALVAGNFSATGIGLGSTSAPIDFDSRSV